MESSYHDAPKPSAKQKTQSFFRRTTGYPESVPVVSSYDYIRQVTGNPGQKAKNYVLDLFPFVRWLPNYNLTWLIADLIAGITVAIVVIPQGMSYAKLATLPPEYGLYSSFVGVCIYWFFATSKDITIGPVAIMSLQTARTIAAVTADQGTKYTAPQIATALAMICGIIATGLGLFRLGKIIEFIPAPAIAGFVTGSALNIAIGQFQGLLGEYAYNTRDPTYLVFGRIFQYLPTSSLDAAFGVTGLVFLYAVRAFFNWAPKRYPRYTRWFFFGQVLRQAFTILALTLASWLVNKNHTTNPRIKILQTVPRGFQHAGVPLINTDIFSAIGTNIPASVIILVMEHISIARSFGRLNNYKVVPNQELLAIGITNIFGTFLGAYPATGSFSRTAIKAKAGVRTPLAGLVTGIIVLISIYALTAVFFYIPSAGLSALIIHAVGDLIASPRTIVSFWRISPLECIIFWASVIVSIFSTIENGLYVAIGLSGGLLLFRILVPRGRFLGRVQTIDEEHNSNGRDIYVPLDMQHPRKETAGVYSESIQVSLPPPGLVVYRLEESLLYPNATSVNSQIMDFVRTHMSPGQSVMHTKLGDRPWNDYRPRHPEQNYKHEDRPRLRAVVLDFHAISHIDSTGVQALVDLRNEVDRYSDRAIEFHFASISSPWVKRALIAGGFGIGDLGQRRRVEVAPVIGQQDTVDKIDESQQREATDKITRARSAQQPLERTTTALEEQHDAIVNIDSEQRATSGLSVPAPVSEDHLKVNQGDYGANGEYVGPGSATTSIVVPIVPQTTQFFHFDVAEAVLVASSAYEDDTTDRSGSRGSTPSDDRKEL